MMFTYIKSILSQKKILFTFIAALVANGPGGVFAAGNFTWDRNQGRDQLQGLSTTVRDNINLINADFRAEQQDLLNLLQTAENARTAVESEAAVTNLFNAVSDAGPPRRAKIWNKNVATTETRYRHIPAVPAVAPVLARRCKGHSYRNPGLRPQHKWFENEAAQKKSELAADNTIANYDVGNEVHGRIVNDDTNYVYVYCSPWNVSWDYTHKENACTCNCYTEVQIRAGQAAQPARQEDYQVAGARAASMNLTTVFNSVNGFSQAIAQHAENIAQELAEEMANQAAQEFLQDNDSVTQSRFRTTN